MKTIHFVLYGCVVAGSSFACLTTTSHAQTPPPLPPLEKNCVFLKEVTSGQVQIRKIAMRGNQNTDFAVPTGVRFTSYIAQLLPENNANYGIDMYFKYNDSSSAKVFSKTISAQRFKRVAGAFRSPTARQPYQINFSVATDENNAYQVAVMACK